MTLPEPSPADDRPFLSIVVPTYQRAAELDRQLAWLHGELVGADVAFEVRVHDNCSTDATPEVTARWQAAFGAQRFHVVRNESNIGGVPNLSRAIAAARGEWVWSLGDDDRVYDGAVAHLVGLLRAEPDLALLLLNYRGVDATTGATTQEHYFEPAMSGRQPDGHRAFAHHVATEIGSVIFLSATVYRTALVHEAQRAWRFDERNWALVAFWTGFVAARGPLHITTENWIDCVVGQSHWQKESGAWTKAVYDEIPRVFLELEREGYPRRFCRREGFKELRRNGSGLTSLRASAQAMRYCPQCVLTLGHLLVGGGWFIP